jgi:hypothetical protein
VVTTSTSVLKKCCQTENDQGIERKAVESFQERLQQIKNPPVTRCGSSADLGVLRGV